jgi:hypothetical protein
VPPSFTYPQSLNELIIIWGSKPIWINKSYKLQAKNSCIADLMAWLSILPGAKKEWQTLPYLGQSLFINIITSLRLNKCE